MDHSPVLVKKEKVLHLPSSYPLPDMSFKKTLLFVILAELLVILLAVNSYGANLEGLQATTRFSGRLSLGIFSVIFFYAIFNQAKLSNILSARPYLIFMIAHTIHLVELISYVTLSKGILIPIRLAGGFLAYLMIFVMPFLQYHFEKGKINQRKYFIAENIYLYYVWFIFFMSYLPRVQGKLPHVGGSYQEFVVLFIWVCLLLAIRIFHVYLSSSSLQPQRSGSNSKME